MTEEQKASRFSTIPECEKLLSLIAQLDGRILYTDAFPRWVGVGSPDKKWRGAGFSSYREIDGADPGAFLGDILPKADFKMEKWTWFDPNPIDLQEDKIETLVQRRLMKPLMLQGEPSGTEQWFIQVYVVPESVLHRPPSPDTGYYYGEPWCKQCNDTFFWSPDVKEKSWTPCYQSAMCCECYSRMPVEYHRPSKRPDNAWWEKFIAARTERWQEFMAKRTCRGMGCDSMTSHNKEDIPGTNHKS